MSQVSSDDQTKKTSSPNIDDSTVQRFSTSDAIKNPEQYKQALNKLMAQNNSFNDRALDDQVLPSHSNQIQNETSSLVDHAEKRRFGLKRQNGQPNLNTDTNAAENAPITQDIKFEPTSNSNETRAKIDTDKKHATMAQDRSPEESIVSTGSLDVNAQVATTSNETKLAEEKSSNSQLIQNFLPSAIGYAKNFANYAVKKANDLVSPTSDQNDKPLQREIPEYAEIPNSRKVGVDDVKRTVKAAGIERAPVVNNGELGLKGAGEKAVVGKLRIPLIFNGTEAVGDDNSVTFERQVLGGAFKRTQVYEKKDGKMEKTLETKVNPLRTVTNEIKTDETGVVTRSKERSNVFGFSDKLEINGPGKAGRLLVQKSNLAYKMNVQAHPQADLNPEMRQKTTALLGMFKGTYDVRPDNTLKQTGYSNPLNSIQMTKVAADITQTRQTDLGGLASRTVQKTDDGTAFVTKDRFRGFYKMEATQAKAADGNQNGVDAKRTIEAGFLGIKAFKREVVIPHEGDMKTTETKVFGVTIRKKMEELSDKEKNTRDAQVKASTLEEQKSFGEKTIGILKNGISYGKESIKEIVDYPVRSVSRGANAVAEVMPWPISVPLKLAGAATSTLSQYNEQRKALNKNAVEGAEEKDKFGTQLWKATTVINNAGAKAIGVVSNTAGNVYDAAAEYMTTSSTISEPKSAATDKNKDVANATGKPQQVTMQAQDAGQVEQPSAASTMNNLVKGEDGNQYPLNVGKKKITEGLNVRVRDNHGAGLVVSL